MAIVNDLGDLNKKRDLSYDDSTFNITPSDTTIQPVSINALYVTVGGTVAFKNNHNTTITLTLEAGGPYLLPGVRYILAAGTTATGLVGMRSKALL